MESALLTTKQVARQLNVDPATIRRWAAAGKLTAVTLPSGRLRFLPETVDALIDNRT